MKMIISECFYTVIHSSEEWKHVFKSQLKIKAV